MSDKKEKAIDQILDLLLDALQERQQERADNRSTQITQIEEEPADQLPHPFAGSVEFEEPEIVPVSSIGPSPEEIAQALEMTAEIDGDEDDAIDNPQALEIDAPESAQDQAYIEAYLEPPEKLPSIHMNRVFYRLCVSLALLLIIVNVPFNRFGTNLARAMPDERALVVRDGLLFKGPGDEIYVLEDNQKRWISSLTAFEVSGFRWDQVHEVDQDFVDQFENGPDFHVIIRCERQPHIYLLEGDVKRWIQNPAAFENAGFKWEDVRYISCSQLKNSYPDGESIPPGADEDRIPSW